MGKKRKNIIYLTGFILLVAIITFLPSDTFSQSNVRPNIVLILSDDQGWGDLGINGNLNLQTPNIDYLAKEGAQFTRFM